MTLDSPSNWITLYNFSQIYPQPEALFNKQLLATKSCTNVIDQYLSLDLQSTSIKCRVIAESPSCGKSFLINYIILYAISKGLKVGVSAMQAYHTVHLRGFHLHIFLSCSEEQCIYPPPCRTSYHQNYW